MIERIKFIHEKEIWLVDLNPAKGIEMQKIRPCLVMKKFSKTHFVILPLTSQKKNTRFFIRLSNIRFLPKDSWICVNQIRTVDKVRFIRKYGELSEYRFKGIQKTSGEVLKLLPQGANAQETKKKSLLNHGNDSSPILH
jgi:mRNA interferase MazF